MTHPGPVDEDGVLSLPLGKRSKCINEPNPVDELIGFVSIIRIPLAMLRHFFDDFPPSQ